VRFGTNRKLTFDRALKRLCLPLSRKTKACDWLICVKNVGIETAVAFSRAFASRPPTYSTIKPPCAATSSKFPLLQNTKMFFSQITVVGTSRRRPLFDPTGWIFYRFYPPVSDQPTHDSLGLSTTRDTWTPPKSSALKIYEYHTFKLVSLCRDYSKKISETNQTGRCIKIIRVVQPPVIDLSSLTFWVVP